MFKCKQCGRAFGANTPEHCPDCGARHDRTARGLLIVSILDNLLGLILLVGLIALLIFGAIYLF